MPGLDNRTRVGDSETPAPLTQEGTAAPQKTELLQMRQDTQSADLSKIPGVCRHQRPARSQCRRRDPKIVFARWLAPLPEILKDFRCPPEHILAQRVDGEPGTEVLPFRPSSEPSCKFATGDDTHLHLLCCVRPEERMGRALLPFASLPIQRHKECRIVDHLSQGERALVLVRPSPSIPQPGSVRRAGRDQPLRRKDCLCAKGNRSATGMAGSAPSVAAIRYFSGALGRARAWPRARWAHSSGGG